MSSFLALVILFFLFFLEINVIEGSDTDVL